VRARVLAVFILVSQGAWLLEYSLGAIAQREGPNRPPVGWIGMVGTTVLVFFAKLPDATQISAMEPLASAGRDQRRRART